MNFEMYGILCSMVLSNVNIYLVNSYLASKHTGLSRHHQILSIIPTFSLCSLSLIMGLLLSSIGVNLYILYFIFIISYLIISILCQIKAYIDTKIIIKKVFNCYDKSEITS